MGKYIEILKDQFINDLTTIKFYFDKNDKKKSGFVIKKNNQFFVYLNECQHLDVELDWQENDFFDEEKKYIVCATHGAMYDPNSGLCISGPCMGAYLKKIEYTETSNKIIINLKD